MLDATLLAVATSLMYYDIATAEHCRRMTTWATALAEGLNLDPSEADALCWATYLHDLGKIAVPLRIMAKPDALSEPEWDEMRRHPVIGAAILRAIGTDDEPVLQAVLHHHERPDGKGYPDGLLLADIPFLARATAVIDAFDAMTTLRPYATQHSFTQAVAILREGADTAWDREVVAVFTVIVLK